MKLLTVTSTNRNDFTGILECEHCKGTAELKTGYSDDYYLNVVIPSMLCSRCKVNSAGTTQGADDKVGIMTITIDSEVKTPVIVLSDNETYVSTDGLSYVINDTHSLYDIARWCLTLTDTDELIYILKDLSGK